MFSFDIKNFPELDYRTKEAMNTLCTNLSFAGGDIRKIMVTSSHPQEGKSFVTMNLMRVFAGLGLRVVLVDADIRASQLQRAYGIRVSDPQSPENRYSGLTRYLAGRCSLEEILGRTNIPNAWMILAGSTVANSLPLFNTPRLKNLLNALAGQFDIVLVDAPPVGTIIDAAKIATACDGTLFVVQSNVVSRPHLANALRQIEKTGCSLLGTVLNQYDDRETTDKYYYYSDNYYNRTVPRERRSQPASRPQQGRSMSKGRSGEKL